MRACCNPFSYLGGKTKVNDSAQKTTAERSQMIEHVFFSSLDNSINHTTMLELFFPSHMITKNNSMFLWLAIPATQAPPGSQQALPKRPRMPRCFAGPADTRLCGKSNHNKGSDTFCYKYIYSIYIASLAYNRTTI